MSRGKQLGVALITAMLVVSLATVAAVAMASRQHLDIRRTSNILDTDQALLYALGAESWASQILARDRRENQTDTLGEDWAKLLLPIAVPGGSIVAAVEDLQGRFNINSLVVDKKPNQVALERFKRLLESLELETNLADAVLDWVDKDVDVRYPNGAEDDEYLREKPAYRTANALMSSTSELMLVKGMTLEAYDTLSPHLTALPDSTPINVNTASVQVIMGLAENIAQSDAEALVESRGEEGFATLDEFLRHESLAGRKVARDGLTVSSEYFVVRAEAHIGRMRARLSSLLHRKSTGHVTVLRRSRSGE